MKQLWDDMCHGHHGENMGSFMIVSEVSRTKGCVTGVTHCQESHIFVGGPFAIYHYVTLAPMENYGMTCGISGYPLPPNLAHARTMHVNGKIIHTLW